MNFSASASDSFLQAEEREGFFVSEKRKRIWKVQLDLLAELDRLCQKHGLTYFVSNGTLLGALKYGGFVPWDDDMDIMMPWPDFKKLSELSSEEFFPSYYFQDGFSEPGYFRHHGRLRDARTTAISPVDCNRSKRSGIFLDIFPIYGIGEENFSKRVKKIKRALFVAHSNVYPKFFRTQKGKLAKIFISRFLFKVFSFEKFLKSVRGIFTRVPLEEAKEVFIWTHGRALVFEKKSIETIRKVPFEWTFVPVPFDSDSILKKQYGDYKNTLPPLSDRLHHHTLFIDPDKPYSEYFGKLSEKEIAESQVDY